MINSLIASFLLALALLCCRSFAQSPAEMRSEVRRAYAKEDARLNAAYKKLLASLDDAAKKKLIASERAWIAYRDAHSMFEADQYMAGPSMTMVARNQVESGMMAERTKQLQNLMTTKRRHAAQGDETFPEADRRLNAVYKELLAAVDNIERYKEDLKASHSAWLAYRDAQAAFEAEIMTQREKAERAYDRARIALTETRIKDLQGFVDLFRSGASSTN